MQNKSEHQLDSSLDTMIQKVEEFKAALQTLLVKIEHDHATINWPSILDSFALLSGQLRVINQYLKHDKTPNLRNNIVLPYLLIPGKDEALEKLTEGRVMVFNHEVVPGYLRTKPEPDVEERTSTIERSVHSNQDVIQKQVTSMNKVVNNMLDLIQTHVDQKDSDMNAKIVPPLTSKQEDTTELIKIIAGGQGLKREDSTTTVIGPGRPGMGGGPVRITAPAHSPVGNTAASPAGNQQTNKAPSSIKTNIRAAHPYSR